MVIIAVRDRYWPPRDATDQSQLPDNVLRDLVSRLLALDHHSCRQLQTV
jgi:hypothetical protein